jgi:CBS domain-containing protein
VERTQTMIAREAAEQLTVGEAMLSHPKTLFADATVADLRRLFERATMRTVLLVDGETFVGTVERPDLPDSAADGEPARSYARLDAERVNPGLLVRDVIPKLEQTREGRLVVVDEDGSTLRGMLCMRSAHDAFCIDA